MEKIKINDLMTLSGVQFGTSGVRGLVSDMTDKVCWSYTTAFLQHLLSKDLIKTGDKVGVAGDLRTSTPRVMVSVFKAALDLGLIPVNYGFIASPAIALYGLHKKIATVMVTGSHIPEDRNGIKFNTPAGEISKQDELAIKDSIIILPSDKFDQKGFVVGDAQEVASSDKAINYYKARFVNFFPENYLHGQRIGVYQHSSVVRDFLVTLLESFGAIVTKLERTTEFVAVDTEAIREEDLVLAKKWAKQYKFDCVLSTDGDGDRPLIGDEKGNWLRGDIVGLLCSQYLNADVVITPVSSNTSVEKSNFFKQVVRTKIGSPYVIAAMNDYEKQLNVAGYEANGGFLQANNINKNGKALEALPTRDAIIVMLSVLSLAKERKSSLSELVATLPRRFTYSDRLKNFPTALSHKRLLSFTSGERLANLFVIKAEFGLVGEPAEIDCTDGVRIRFENEDIIHLRPSGNAPELRCYTESNTQERAYELNKKCLEIMSKWQ